MDVQMPRTDGIEATADVVAEDLGRVVILTTFDRDDYLFAALDAGASGFLLKNCEADQLVEAVRAVGRGHALLSPEVTRRVIAEMTDAPARRPSPPAEDAAGLDAADRARARGAGAARARGSATPRSPHGWCWARPP